MFSRIVDRRCCNHAGVNSELLELFNRFRNKATAHLISVRREKWCQRQNVQTMNVLSIILKPGQDTPSIVNVAMLIELQTQARSLLRRSGLVPLLNRVRSVRSEEHTSELQSPDHLVCRLLLEKKQTSHLCETQ